MDTRIWLFIISVALSALFVGIAIPLVLRRIPPNRWYGLRVPATLTDERVWYEANVVAGWDFIRVGVVTFLAGLLFMLLSPALVGERSPVGGGSGNRCSGGGISFLALC